MEQISEILKTSTECSLALLAHIFSVNFVPVIARWSKWLSLKRLYIFQVSSHDKMLNMAVMSGTKWKTKIHNN